MTCTYFIYIFLIVPFFLCLQGSHLPLQAYFLQNCPKHREIINQRKQETHLSIMLIAHVNNRPFIIYIFDHLVKVTSKLALILYEAHNNKTTSRSQNTLFLCVFF